MDTENLEEKMQIIDFWKRVNDLLKSKGFTQDSFSELCGFTRNRINNWTSKKTLPNVLEAYIISQKLDVSIDFLVTGNDGGQVDKAKDKAFEAIQYLQSVLLSSQQ